MMKPGPRDIKVQIRIDGDELDELQRFTCDMSEAFGLDRRIANYQGKRPIGLYSWDFDCLLSVVEQALEDTGAYPDEDGPDYQAMRRLQERLQDAYRVFE